MQHWHRTLFALQENFYSQPAYRRPQPIRSHSPLSTTDYKQKSDMPRLVPYYEPTSHMHSHISARLRAYLFAHKASCDPSITPMTSDDTPVILDSGCSITICNDRMDFVGKIHPAQDAPICGIGANLPIEGVGTVHWSFMDINGVPVTMKLTALYVPKCPVNLLPPQQLCKAPHMDDSNNILITREHVRVSYQRHVIEFPIRSSQPAANQETNPQMF